MFLKLFNVASLFALVSKWCFVSGTTYCYDSNECQDETITDSYVYCYGYYGCYSSVISATYGLYCNGYYGCYDSIVSAVSYLSCSGRYSCYSNEIASIGSSAMYVDGPYAAAYSKITGSVDLTSYMYLYGYASAYNSEISETERILGYGYYSVAYATIDTYGVDSFYLYLYGYYSGYYTYLYCNEGSTCNIYCQGNGCYNTKIICMSNSNCNIDCDSSCEDCPSVYNMTTSNTMIEMNKELLKIDETMTLEYRQTNHAEKRKIIKSKSDELEAKYGEKEGKKQFEKWNEEFIASETKDLPLIEELDNNGFILSLTENVGNNYNKIILIVSIISVFILLFGIFIGCVSSNYLNKNKDYSYQQI